MEIPHRSLKPETLRALIEEFVTREGTFVGDGDAPSLDAQVARVERALERGEVFVAFDDESETATIVARER